MNLSYLYRRLLFIKLRLIVFAFFLVSSTFNSFSQSTANYTFSASSNGSFTDMSSGTTTLTTSSSTTADDASAVEYIGFPFFFRGTLYTQFSVNNNGLLRLGGSVVSNAYTNDITASSNTPLITAFWDDINNASDQATNGTSKVFIK